MPTTFEAFAGQQPRNYHTLPTIDVEILPAVRHCEADGAEVIYDQSKGYFGQWVHADGTAGHYVAPRTFCTYCNADETGVVENKLYAWYDATECSRCGAVYGRPLGD